MLLLGQVLQLLGERGLLGLAGGGAARARVLEHGVPGPRRGLPGQRRASHRLGVRAQLRAVAGGQRERVLAVAERQARARGRRVGLDALPDQALGELVGGQRVEAHRLAARGDRRHHLAGPVGQQQQDDVGRGLLERLEQRVGRLVVHRLGALEHEHAVGGLERRSRGGGDHGLADVAAQHLVRAARRDPREVGVRAVHHARARGLDPSHPGRAAREQRRGERAGGGALAAARRAVQEVGVRQAPVESGAEHRARVGMGVELLHRAPC